MSHHVTLKDLPLDGERLDASRTSSKATILLGAGGAGVVICLILLLFGPAVVKQSMAYSWLLAVFLAFTIACGGIFWVLLHHASNSGWGVAVRRVMESVGNMIPWVGVLALPLLLPDVREQLWHWMAVEREVMEAAQSPEAMEKAVAHHAHEVEQARAFVESAEAAGQEGEAAIARERLAELEGHAPTVESIFLEKLKKKDALLAGKVNYLNTSKPWGFIPRFFIYFIFLTLFIKVLRGKSIAQDRTGDLKTTYWTRKWSCGMLPLFAIFVTFAAIDWVKGINHHWFSTMWGVYIFAGAAFASMSVVILVVTWLRQLGHLEQVVSKEHYHIMGKLLFAFTVFWAYIAFSQFFLIWYANIPEETQWFLVRNTEHYNLLNIILVVLHFVVPFILLLPAWVKRTPRYLAIMAGYALVVHLLDLWLLIIPQRGPAVLGDTWYVPHSLWLDLLAVASVLALLAGLFIRSLYGHSLYPSRDPRLLESLHMHS